MLSAQLFVAVLGLLEVQQAGSHPPQTLEQIPIYPGAARNREAEAHWDEEQRQQRQRESGVRPGAVRLSKVVSTLRAYRLKAPVDAVVKYYRDQLGAREPGASQTLDRLDETGRVRVAIGATSPVILQVEAYDFKGEMAERYGEDPQAGIRKLTALFTRRRPPYRPGVWLRSGDFTWTRRDDATRTTSFGVTLRDEGLPDPSAGTLENATSLEIVVEQETEPTEAEADEPEELQKPGLAEPAAADLGVPGYPGARFDRQMSGSMSSEQERNFLYGTADSPERVVAFYESRTGKKAARTEGGWLLAVRDGDPMPELTVAIQPNVGTYPPAIKTMIIVRRLVRP